MILDNFGRLPKAGGEKQRCTERGARSEGVHCSQEKTKPMWWIEWVNRLQIPAEQESEGWWEKDGFKTNLDFVSGAVRVLSSGGG